jgi:hypothetical protein
MQNSSRSISLKNMGFGAGNGAPCLILAREAICHLTKILNMGLII